MVGASLGRFAGLVAEERKGVLSGWILREEVLLKSVLGVVSGSFGGR